MRFGINNRIILSIFNKAFNEKKSKLVFFSEIGEYGFSLKASFKNALNNNNKKKTRTDIFNNGLIYGNRP